MALLFSAVTLTGDDDQVELLVPGIPKESNDLRGWTAYENFIASIDHEQEIRVYVAACLYGEGQPFPASPEEVAYFTLRAKEDDSFLCDHCSHAGHSDFQFTWSPEMSHGKETNVMNEWERIHRQAERYKREYPAGTRITVLQMGDDPRPVENGTRGTVRVVDDMGTVHCDFDNGRRLGLIPGEDSFRKLTDAELAEEQDADISEEETGPVMGM